MGVLLIFYALVEMFELELCSKCLRRHVQKFMHIYIRVLSYGLKSLLVDEILDEKAFYGCAEGDEYRCL